MIVGDLRFMSLFLKAKASGAYPDILGWSWRWNLHGGCLQPREVDIRPARGAPQVLILHVRCRTCDNCRYVRTGEWMARAIRETVASRRTWLLTLTHGREDRRILSAYSGDGVGGPSLQAMRWSAACVGRFCHRLRYHRPGTRYLAVLETHRDGTPHWHLLVHETEAVVTKRFLQTQWKGGFSNCKLVRDAIGARYAAKYVAKSMLRVRASVSYGISHLNALTAGQCSATLTLPLPNDLDEPHHTNDSGTNDPGTS